MLMANYGTVGDALAAVEAGVRAAPELVDGDLSLFRQLAIGETGGPARKTMS
jgi:hypothetical protein